MNLDSVNSTHINESINCLNSLSKMLKNTIIFISVLVSGVLFSQTGPGGIGNSANNGLWLRTDTFSTFGGTVNPWLDSSGNGNNAGQVNNSKQPVSFATSNLNGMPIVRFDGANDEMIVPDADILDNSAGVSIFTVLKFNNLDGKPRAILAKRTAASTVKDYSYAWFMWKADFLNLDIASSNNRFKSNPVKFSNATNYILSFTFDGTLAPPERSKMYSEMDLVKVDFESSDFIDNSEKPVTIGTLNEGYGNNLGADYAEIIHFNYTLTEVDRIIVNNYLSAKYNIPISSNDFYNEDDASSGNFDHKVAGIGQSSDGSSHINSQGTGIITIKNPTDLQNNEYLFWGENANNATYNFAETAAGSTIFRLNKIWRTSETGDVGAVGFSVKSADLNFTSPSSPTETLQLIRSTTPDFTAITQKYNLSLNNGVYSTPSVIFNDNDYFTLQVAPTVDLSLINLVNKAIVKNGEVVLFTISVTNSSNNTATGVQIKDILPAGLLFNSANSVIPSGTTYSATTGIWDFGSRAIFNGQTVTLTIAATAQTVINSLSVNKAEIIATDQEDFDSNPNNGN